MTIFYALTITLKPKMYNHQAEEQYDIAKPVIYNMNLGEATVICELTKAYNVHFHCLIEVNETATFKGPKGKLISFERYVCDKFRNNPVIGFVYVKKCTDKSGWITYMLKDIEQTKQNIARQICVRDDFNLCPLFT